MILQAFVDDSKSETGDKAFYLAGYLQRADVWEGFIKEWNAALAEPPKVEHVHMVDANALKGQFDGWSKADSKKKILRLGKLIQRHNLVSFCTSIKQKDFDRYIKPIAPYNLQQPYFSCFWATIINLSQHLQNEVGNCSINFVFDEQKGIGEEAVEWFEVMREWNPSLKYVLSSTPIFADDKQTNPLQAADILAWHLRRDEERKEEKLEALDTFMGATHISIRINKKTVKQIALGFMQITGVNTISTKKQWKKVKRDVSASLSSGISPTAPRGNIFYRATKYLFALIKLKRLSLGDKSR